MPVSIGRDSYTINSLFSGEGYKNLFVVPPTQRRYKWDKTQVDQLWSDILTAQEQDRPSYFLGTLLLTPLATNANGMSRVSVIDGQQRITTLSLLIAVLRDHCEQYPDLKNRADVLHRLIARLDNDGNPRDVVVTLQESDNDIYKSLVATKNSTGTISVNSKHKHKLQKAVAILKERVGDRASTETALRSLCEYIQEKVQILPIEVGSETEGHLLFDTTNTRGLRISPSEALKAHVAAITREDAASAADLLRKWDAAANSFDRADLPIDVMDDYLHLLWSSKYGHTKKATANNISKNITSMKEVREIVDDISTYTNSYLAILRPESYLGFNARTKQDVRDLSHLNVQAYGFLTMVHHHDPTRFSEALELTLSLQIRNITITNHDRPNAYEKDWPRWAVLARKGDTATALSEIRSNIGKVSDRAFEDSFKTARIMAPGTAKYLLRKLDPVSAVDSGAALNDIDLEHILPKSVSKKLLEGKTLTKKVKRWVTDLDKPIPGTDLERIRLGHEIERSLHMLGNQALLHRVPNRKGKDDPFDSKKGLYGNQVWELTKGLSTRAKWNTGTIRDRQEQLSKDAVTVWNK